MESYPLRKRCCTDDTAFGVVHHKELIATEEKCAVKQLPLHRQEVIIQLRTEDCHNLLALFAAGCPQKCLLQVVKTRYPGHQVPHSFRHDFLNKRSG